jgi:chitodextrinase
LVCILFLVSTIHAALSAPATLSTANLKATSLTLKWTASTGATGGVAGYDVYKDGVLVGSTTTARSLSVTGLSPLTTYSMTVVARDNGGNTSLPSTVLAAVTAADTTVPAKPTHLVASRVNTTSFTLTWSPSTDNVGVVGYNIYRVGVLVGATDVPTFAVAGQAPNATHRMIVRARDAAGNLSAGIALNVRTLAEAPSSPTALTVLSLKAASFTLTWTASTGGTGGIAGYDV